MKVIDAHLHFSNIESFRRTAGQFSHVVYSGEGLKKEFEDNCVVAGIGMGLTEKSPGGFPDFSSPNPMTLDLEEDVPEFLLYCVGINPVLLEGDNKKFELEKLEKELENERVAGIKIYAGYYRYYVHDPIYRPVYDLARKYSLPVVIHSGDTYSERGLLKYSHPLNIDELAVENRDINFIITHLGDPWVMDTAEIVLKNYNVYADLSGLIVGDEKKIKRLRSSCLFTDHFKQALFYADTYDRMLFGTDWPLVPVGAYIEFIHGLIPLEFHDDVFYGNALKVFPRLEKLIGEGIQIGEG